MPAVREVTGDVLFARYAFPPNELGYCGPADPEVLLRHAVAGTAPSLPVIMHESASAPAGPAGEVDEIRRRARQFEGAWVYLELIAAAAGIADPLDARVVEAYWIGNDILDRVVPESLVADLGERFAGQLIGPAGRRWARLPIGTAAAHHSFHVLAVYPWVGMLRSAGAGSTGAGAGAGTSGVGPGGRDDVALSVLDRCRIRWGTVTGRDGDRLLVRSRPLIRDGHRLALGAERIEPVRWTSAGHQRPDVPEPGTLVSCHWDWVCDRLTPAQLAQLTTRSARQLAAANSIP